MCVHKLVPLLWPLGPSQLATWVSWVTSSVASVIGTRDYEQVKILLKTRQASLLSLIPLLQFSLLPQPQGDEMSVCALLCQTSRSRLRS